MSGISSGIYSRALLAATFLVVGLVGPLTAFAAGPAAINLGTAGNYVILAKTGISTTGSTAVVGNLGVSPVAASYITGFALTLPAAGAFSTSAMVTGKVYASDYANPTPSALTTAVLDMQTAYTDGAGRASTVTELGAGNIGGLTLVPGVYKWGTGVTIPADVTLSGSANDVWIFQIAQGLNLSSGVKIVLSGGAQANNVFWVVAGQTTIGTTATFNGNILDQTAIVLNTGATLNGRALAQTAVTLDSNSVTIPSGAVGTPPTCTLSTSPGSIQKGSSSALSWTTANATTFTINNAIGSVTPVASSSTSVSPTATTTYTGTATGPGGSVTCSTTVTVTVTPPPTATSCTLSANPTTIQGGSSSTLSWTTINATLFVIDNNIGTSSPVASSSTSVSPTATTTYTGTATGPGGSVTCSTTVTVTTPPPPTCHTYSLAKDGKITGSDNKDIATLTIPANVCPVEVSFSSYNLPDGKILPYSHQVLYDNITNTYGPGTHTIGPLKLACNWQTDLYLGGVQTTLGSSGTQGLIAYDDLTGKTCVSPPPAPTCTSTQHLNTDTHICVDSTSTPVLGCTDPTASNYNPAATQGNNSCVHSSSDLGGGGSGCALGTAWSPNASSCVPVGQVLGTSTTGEVLGASCGLYMTKHIQFGSPKNDSDQVMKLQTFLNKWMNTNLPITGIYDLATLAALNTFQTKYSDQVLMPWGINAPTGLVYLSTLREINLLECPDLSIPLPTLIPWDQNPNAQ